MFIQTNDRINGVNGQIDKKVGSDFLSNVHPLILLSLTAFAFRESILPPPGGRQ